MHSYRTTSLVWLTALLELLALTSAARAQETPENLPNRQAARAHALVFDEAHAVFDDSYQRSVARHVYRFENRSAETVRVLETVVVAGEADLIVEPSVIAPGASGVAKLRQPLEDRLGETAFRYAIVTDEPGGARYRFTLTGFVQSAYEPERPILDFGIVDRRAGGTAEFELFSREVDRLGGIEAVDVPSYVEVTVPGRSGVAGEGVVVLASLSPQAPEGYLQGAFSLRAGVPHQPGLLVQWRAIVAGDVVPVENPLDLGVADIGYVREKELRLVSRNGLPFNVERVEADDAFGFDQGPCADVEEAQAALCRVVTISWTPQDKQRLGGAIRLFIEGQAHPITVRYRGMSVPPGTEIRELKLVDEFGEPAS